ncbi:hypothetical protein GOO32_004339 [Salmonella enterica]|nr:hypothetical protein [Salmonella enterica]EDQ0146584.1 hypothetical protein [Salmonella enterica subsp. enterica serovar Sandiego]EDV7107076.1 hypothetical protein [Salmonella enterica subsp. enterica]EDQ4123933.1 hypothetical protein [Salmonella enterica subsp. enterica serovar Sandiego]EDQ5266445.1 hypothetical protein [Salmonella enterica]
MTVRGSPYSTIIFDIQTDPLYTAAAEGRREEALEYLREGRKLLRQ